MSLSDIIYEKINDEYSYGKYGDFKIIIMNSNSYVNATKLCNEYNESKSDNEPEKRFRKWKENSGGDKLINEVNRYIQARPHSGGLSDVSIIADNTSINELRGTYVHPLLVPHIASWISPKFAIKVSEIVNNYIVRQYKYLMNQKDNKIDELQEEIKLMRLENKAGFTLINYKFDNLSDVLLERTEELEISKTKTEISSDDRINIPSNICNIEHMVVLRSNISTSIYKYRMIRGTYSYVKAKIGSLAGIYFKKLSKKNTNTWTIDESIKSKKEYELVKIYTDIPNARHLFRAVKDKNIITFNGVNFNILISEEDVFTKFQEAFDSRLTIEIEEEEILIAKTKASKLYKLDLLKIH